MQQHQKPYVCIEAPVALFVNQQKITTFMCTPQDLVELALGHLYGRKIIKDRHDIKGIAACQDLRQIHVQLNHNLNEDDFTLSTVLATACGSGTVFNDDFLELAAVKSSLKISIERLKEITKTMFAEAILQKQGGGMHCAALALNGDLKLLFEDVGRHNALDKAIGSALAQDLDFSYLSLHTTGRIASDMILKALAAGIGVVVSRSIPTSLALEIAEKKEITLIGRIVKDAIIYAHPQRIVKK